MEPLVQGQFLLFLAIHYTAFRGSKVSRMAGFDRFSSSCSCHRSTGRWGIWTCTRHREAQHKNSISRTRAKRIWVALLRAQPLTRSGNTAADSSSGFRGFDGLCRPLMRYGLIARDTTAHILIWSTVHMKWAIGLAMYCRILECVSNFSMHLCDWLKLCFPLDFSV